MSFACFWAVRLPLGHARARRGTQAQEPSRRINGAHGNEFLTEIVVFLTQRAARRRR
jgi:hypothetical protein